MATPLYFNVMDYGAMGTNSNNDAPGINGAISAAAMYGGGTIVFPSGKYVVDDEIAVGTPNIEFQGQGMGSTSILQRTSGGNTVVIGSGVEFTRISGLDFGGYLNPSTMETVMAGSCISAVSGGKYLWIERVNLSDCTNGVDLSGGWTSVWLDRVISSLGSSSNDCIRIGVTDSVTQNSEIHLTDCVFGGVSGTYSGIHMRAVNGVYGVNCDIIGCGYGLLCDPPAGTECSNALWTGCSWDLSGEDGIHISPANSSTSQVYLFTFSNCWSCGSTQNGCVLQAVGSSGVIDMIIFEGHKFNNNRNTYGLVVGVGSQNVTVSNSEFFGNKGAVAMGFVIASGCNGYVNVSNNIFGNSTVDTSGGMSPYTGQTSGISLSANCPAIIVQGNNFTNLSIPITYVATPQATWKISQNVGVNPVGYIVTTSGGTTQNSHGVDCTVYVTGTNITSIYVGAVAPGGGAVYTGLTSGAIRVPAGAYLSVAYGSGGSARCVWIGD